MNGDIFLVHRRDEMDSKNFSKAIEVRYTRLLEDNPILIGMGEGILFCGIFYAL
ncbi:hypothetical protein Q7M76_04390 [Candidatus Liberibacter asiaticus]|uniref:Uncharacterized protein n=2 Tax=Liberibacter asiaticus TaxID=34021 RepID=C6XGG4_LIBAP|nr:hypothetical protein [Candidatus Liberibacter asiaticus]ACT57467.1 hypothetical protein CLIBASIA_04475 [Candidatus Liberibacter asiaticus str. psy62]AGH17233.1 hypothetical protein WSI_04315 [Candidatus Liberibacter asiaticus str. gxpsy]MBA2917756.1 hypothetical protein [Candidatus Liberibacter asiaticus]MBE2996880.1 hypothetical protein [Candidatus Liberibacter asiaticus]MCU7488536.1 hypothetical protein [Candidatus Liberibacter asiaticus]